MSNTAEKLPGWYAAEMEADAVVAALEQATKNFSLALVDQDVARSIKQKHEGSAAMCSLRLQNDIYEITKERRS